MKENIGRRHTEYNFINLECTRIRKAMDSPVISIGNTVRLCALPLHQIAKTHIHLGGMKRIILKGRLGISVWKVQKSNVRLYGDESYLCWNHSIHAGNIRLTPVLPLCHPKMGLKQIVLRLHCRLRFDDWLVLEAMMKFCSQKMLHRKQQQPFHHRPIHLILVHFESILVLHQQTVQSE